MLSTNGCIRRRMQFMASFLVLAGIALGVRLYFVQVVDHRRMLEKATRQVTSVKVTSGKRGEIYDVHGNLLVGNMPSVAVSADPSLIRDARQRRLIAWMLARKLGMDESELYEKLAPIRPVHDADGRPVLLPDGTPKLRTMRNVLIAANVSLEEAEAIRAAAKANRFQALFFKDGNTRFYPKGRLLANILGFTNVNGDELVPVQGLEKFFDREIASSVGREVYERDRGGRPLPFGQHRVVNSRDGANIYLTVDEALQSIMEEELDAAYEKWQPKALYAVMADPRTGNILAIAQRPTFNPNDRRKIAPDAWRCRIIEDAMEPGSIMKPFSVSGALDCGVVTPESVFDCEKGVWFYLGKPLRDSHPYSLMSVADIIKTSSNIGTAKIALQLGPERVYRTIRSFGFGQPTGLPLKPESLGLVPPVKRWDGLSITRFPIGYAIMVSPVQMVRAYCALANNGWLPKMRLVDRVRDPETGEFRKMPVEPPVQVFTRPDTCRLMVEMLCRVTGEGGTARRAAIPGYQVAGKTGTSRKYVKGRGYIPKYFASFAGFVPADRPALVMLVTTDEPKGGSYGGTVSGPVFRAIAERALKYMNVPPDPALLPDAAKNAAAGKAAQ